MVLKIFTFEKNNQFTPNWMNKKSLSQKAHFTKDSLKRTNKICG
jgi:hypothetical protein